MPQRFNEDVDIACLYFSKAFAAIAFQAIYAVLKYMAQIGLCCDLGVPRNELYQVSCEKANFSRRCFRWLSLRVSRGRAITCRD